MPRALFEGAATPVYLATGSAGDGEMGERIALHRARRGEHWRTVEEPFDLAGALRRESRPGQPVMVDCLTLWLGNLMGHDRDVEAAFADLLAALRALTGPVVMVSNEVGWGIVPDNALARRFRDPRRRPASADRGDRGFRSAGRGGPALDVEIAPALRV